MTIYLEVSDLLLNVYALAVICLLVFALTGPHDNGRHGSCRLRIIIILILVMSSDYVVYFVPMQPGELDKKYSGLLEKKWTSVIRLQKKVSMCVHDCVSLLDFSSGSRLPVLFTGRPMIHKDIAWW